MEKPVYFYTFTTPTGTKKEQVPLSTALIIQQAELMGVKWSILPGTRIFRLEHNNVVRHFRYQISPNTSYVGFHACLDKSETNALLSANGISTAKGFLVKEADDLKTKLEVFNTLSKPLVVKPSNGLQGKSITVGINTEDEYLKALDLSFSFPQSSDAGAIVEEQFIGKEYRVLTSREKVLGVIHRIPANIVGDGSASIDQLIDEKNSDPRRGKTLDFALMIIEKDEDLIKNLKEQNLELSSIPKEGEKIFLRKVSNIMQGGDSIDFTDLVHPTVRDIAVKAVRSIPELNFAGVDFMTKDITAPQNADSYIIIEINSSPGLCIHEFPYEGNARKTDLEFLYIMFPELRSKQ